MTALITIITLVTMAAGAVAFCACFCRLSSLAGACGHRSGRHLDSGKHIVPRRRHAPAWLVDA